ncbi:glutamate--tRNA ligase, partial [Candidatus Woesearchaeota archaeon]|nr:glutamate--tRNA ligase [Candidatus Woesearchaeota archaeon]
MKDTILKHCLKNIYEFGSVNPKVVLGLTLRDHPDLKKDVPKVLKEIDNTIKEISKLSKEEAKSKLEELAPELLKEKKEEVKGPLKPLPNAKEGKVVLRIAPSPSGPLHIGHAYGSSLNYEYMKMYNGKFIVRIEDTNPDNIYPDAYELIKEDTNWITDNAVSQIVIQSERLGIYYDYAEKLVQKNKAYVCICNSDEWRELKKEGQACPCRDLDVKEQQIRYAKMFNEYAEGEAVLKLKTDIKDKNPAMRDFSLMRINERIHPKTGKEQRVWPLMVFSVAIDDHELGITHVLNGKDHHDNGIKEALIMKYLGWKTPEYKHWGKINFEGFKLSTTKTKLAVEQGEYSGWDDIRLMTLLALRKRGYQAGAFRKYALEIGLSLNDKTVCEKEFWKNINAFNKELIEEK